MQDKPEFGSRDATAIFIQYYRKQLILLEKLYQHQFTNLQHLSDTRLGILYFLLFGIQRTGVCIDLLAQGFNVNECYILARSFLERAITYVYVLYCDEDEYQNYLSYTKQKAFRNLDRKFKAGKMEVRLSRTGSIDLSKEPELEKAIDRFTSKTGKAKTRWTNKNLSDMLEIIEAKGQVDVGIFMFADLWIYDDASKALHGTTYGALFHMGVYSGNTQLTEEDIKKSFNELLSATLQILGMCIHTLMTAFDKTAPIEEFLTESKENVKAIGQILDKTKSERESE